MSMIGSEILLTFKVNLAEVVNEITKIAREIELINGSEEDLKIGIEKLLDQKVWRVLEIPKPRYEFLIKGVSGATVKHYRLDALYGLTIFEYKRPRTLSRSKDRDEAIKKVRDEYILTLLADEKVREVIKGIRGKGLTPRVAGIIIDGYNVVFIDCSIDSYTTCRVEPEVGSYRLDVERLRRIIRIVIAAYRKKLDAKTLASDFGYTSSIARKAVKTLYNALTNAKSLKSKAMFEEWVKIASQAYPLSGEELRKIAVDYGFSEDEAKSADGLKLFYAIQTYYSLILKLLAAETAARFYDSAASEFIKSLLRIESCEKLKEQLALLESGFVYRWYDIKNFLEGEMFSWYLDEWCSDICEVVKDIIRTLDEYDVEVLSQDLSSARDMFKLLYEELVPRKEVRKYLGIYTTPDWLAELILDKLGLNVECFKKLEEQGRDPLSIKVLDPGVGTGTFLSLVIQRIAAHLKQKYGGVIPSDVAKRALLAITKNVIGFDIDALAILTAKTNYLLALAASELLAHKEGEEIEIPIYMTNSVVTAEERKDKAIVVIGSKPVTIDVVKIPIAVEEVKEFLLPLKLVKSSDEFRAFLSEIGSLLERELHENSPEVLGTLRRYARLCGSEEEREAWIRILTEFYSKLLVLKKQGIDTIWLPIIKSHIVSTVFEKMFDYVVGNPPWIAYRYIANPEYQSIVKSLITNVYGLVLEEHLMTQMEMATLFFVRTLDLYLKDGGMIGFVMPRSIFSADQHSNFRAGKTARAKYKIVEIIDCENVEPLFYVPTCAIIGIKGGETAYPVKALVVSGKLPENKHKILPLEEVKKLLSFEAKNIYLNSLGSRTWLDYKQIALQGTRSYYYGFFKNGATIYPQVCWFVEVVDVQPEFAVVRTSKRIEVRGKIEHEMPLLPVEKKFIYGVLTSAEVMPFCHLSPSVAVLPILPAGSGYTIVRREEAQRRGCTKLAKWLEEAEKVWSEIRGGKVGRMSIYERLDYQRGLTAQSPRAKFKVVYLRSGTNLAAAIVDVERTLKENRLLNGVVIGHTLYYYETDNIEEAYYLVAILNSSILDQLIKPMQTRGEFGERDISKKPLEFPIPKYDPNNEIHKRLSELGKKASEIAQRLLPLILSQHEYDKKLAERGVLMPQEVATVRREIRERLKDLIQQIDDLVVELLKVGASSRSAGVPALDKYFRKA
uniref:site-specific DNA-methyltransferase (adenine-specific) n=1 Tax=Ignisphaera aggregans TaxID=334771 RepID=A0A7J2TBJ4_9CREN